MRSLAPLLFIGILILSSCSPQDATQLIGEAENTPIPPEPTQSGANPTSTIEPEPPTPVESSVTPTSPPEPTEVNAISHLAAGLPVTITYINMLGPDVGWGIGWIDPSEDHILFTKDGGISWEDRTPPDPALPAIGERKAASGFFLNSNHAWVRYLDSTTVWRTLDGGRTWSAGPELDVEIHYPTEIIPHSLQFINESVGWVMIYLESGMSQDWTVLYGTLDGGLSWEPLQYPGGEAGISGCCKTGAQFYNATTGIVTYGIGPYPAPHYSMTFDGGRTWTLTLYDLSQIEEADFDITNCEAHSPHMFDENLIRVGMSCTTYSEPIEEQGYIYTSGDAGETWSFDTYPGGALHFNNPQIGWALGRDIYRTMDGGSTWSWMAAVNWDAEFDFINDNVGWAVAHDGDEIGLVKTENGGTTWALLEPEIGE